jgi:methylated-DNA-[protein]-cysteine S-methyltransferase
MTSHECRIDSPLGPMILRLRGDAVTALRFDATGAAAAAAAAPPAALAHLLARYFAGDLDALDRIATDAAGTPFQRRVWAALREVRPGATTTYRALAGRIGAPRACRAVGGANAANPIALIVPCHRVVPLAGGVGGYAFEPWRKTWLLAHERAAGHRA